MTLILDTSFLIALNDVGDFNYKSANSVKIRIKNEEFGQCYISDYIFDEFVTLLMAKSFPQTTIKEAGDVLLAEDDIKILKVDTDIFLQSWELFKKSSGLSFTDCTTIILAKEFRIKNVASFDSDFDRIQHIKRISK